MFRVDVWVDRSWLPSGLFDLRSDRLTSRYGRRRPIILAGLVSTWVAGVLYLGTSQQLQDVASLFHLGGGFKYVLSCFIFTPNLGELIQYDEHIFQMGRNHLTRRWWRFVKGFQAGQRFSAADHMFDDSTGKILACTKGKGHPLWN